MAYFIYSANSSGIAAACTAARRGTDVFLIDPGSKIGAMWGSGLGQTDRESTFKTTPNVSLRWGFLRTFTIALATYAGLNSGGSSNELLLASNAAVLSVFQAQLDLYSEAKVTNGKRTGKITVVKNAPLQAVTKNRAGTTILSVTCGGTVYVAQNYSDCSDEGDLARMAGVTMRIGRESSSLAGEPTNGVRGVTSNGALAYDPATGDRWPDLDPRPYQNIGDADGRTMAFNMRILVTQTAGFIAWADLNVPNFNPREHDLELAIAVARNYKTIPGSISNSALRPVGTYAELDMNNGGLIQIGSNWIGKWLDWPNMTYAEREVFKNAYIRRTASLFKTICTDPAWAAALPDLVADTKLYGLIPGMFPDSFIPGFSPHVYVRESYRIVGQDDMVWDDCVGPEQDIAEPITAYGYPHADAHWVNRCAGELGIIVFEGGSGLENGQEIVATFMKWGAVKARYGEAKNLTVVRCISGTKMGWITVRLEMCWMKIAQACAIAASVANDNDMYTGDLDYQKHLKPALVAEGAIISLPRAA